MDDNAVRIGRSQAQVPGELVGAGLAQRDRIARRVTGRDAAGGGGTRIDGDLRVGARRRKDCGGQRQIQRGITLDVVS